MDNRGPNSRDRLPGSETSRRGLMQWVTRERPKTDRIACPWLIRKYIDHDAEIVYIPRDQVLAYAAERGARSFDSPGAEFTHRDDKCTFEVLVEEFDIEDPAVRRLAMIVHGADISGAVHATPQSAGLLAIAEGFGHVEQDDQKLLAMELPVYDALYAWCSLQESVEEEP
jgi:hypothetical protein